MLNAPSITWRFVSTSPSDVRRMPVPAALRSAPATHAATSRFEIGRDGPGGGAGGGAATWAGAGSHGSSITGLSNGSSIRDQCGGPTCEEPAGPLSVIAEFSLLSRIVAV